jgi:hypothetical protein
MSDLRKRVQATEEALNVALDALANIAMENVEPAKEEAMSALRRINGIMCGDSSRMYRVPSERSKSCKACTGESSCQCPSCLAYDASSPL